MTGAAPGGAEFAAVELLDALVARGHDAVMLSDLAEIGRDTRVAVRPLELGPKLSARSWPGLAIRWPELAEASAGGARGRASLRRPAAPLQEGAASQPGPPTPSSAADRLGRVGTDPAPVAGRTGPLGLRDRLARRRRGAGDLRGNPARGGCRRGRSRQGDCPSERDADRRDPLQRRGQGTGPDGARNPTGRVHGRLHLPLPPRRSGTTS